MVPRAATPFVPQGVPPNRSNPVILSAAKNLGSVAIQARFFAALRMTAFRLFQTTEVSQLLLALIIGLLLSSAVGRRSPTGRRGSATSTSRPIRLELLFANSSKGVLMPRDKVLALWKEAQRHAPPPPAPPAGAVLSRAVYEARLEDRQLRVTGRVRVVKLCDGWQAVDLAFGGLAIESAQLGGQPARFGRKPDGTLFLVLEKLGRFDLELEMSAPLANQGGDLATTLRLPPTPATEVLVRLDQGKQLQLGELALPADGIDEHSRPTSAAVILSAAKNLGCTATEARFFATLRMTLRAAATRIERLFAANSYSTSPRIATACCRW